MTADHSNVAKYSSREDPNFIALTNTLRDWVKELKPDGREADSSKTFSVGADTLAEPRDDERHQLPIKRLANILAVQEAPETDLSRYRERDGTCGWLQRKQSYHDWTRNSDDAPRVLWLTGLPGMGKSTVTQYIIERLNSQEGRPSSYGCQYHLFTEADGSKRSAAYALRSIAFQLALTFEVFRNKLLGLHQETGITFDRQNLNVVWSRIFESILFKLDLPSPLFWAFDALDEADVPVSLVKLIYQARPKCRVKVFFTSRPSPNLISLASSRKPFLRHESMTEDDTKSDIILYVRAVVNEVLLTDEEIQETVIDEILRKASGSFLWVKLGLETLRDRCHTQEDIQNALNEVPEGMEKLYRKLLDSIEALKTSDPRNYPKAYRMLALVACSARPLSVEEMKVALETEFTSFYNLEKSIDQLCGHFVKIGNSKVQLIHETARSFLLDPTEDREAFLDRGKCHEHLAKVCLSYLCDEEWRPRLSRIQAANPAERPAHNRHLSSVLTNHPFTVYATFYWAYHVSQAPVESKELFTSIQKFFDKYALSWIHAVVVMNNLRILTRSAQYLKLYVRESNSSPSSYIKISLAREDAKFLRLWAEDLIRVVGKYGLNLYQVPSCIYHVIPPLCPRESMIYKTYAQATGIALSVAGLSSQIWDDNLARLSIGEGKNISKVISTETYIVCLVDNGGVVVVYYAETCEELRRMNHGEWVTHIAANSTGSAIVTAGITKCKVWEISSGEELYQLPWKTDSNVMTIVFGSDDSEVLVGCDDCSVTSYNMESGTAKWKFVAVEADDKEHSCPRAMALSPDLTRVALAFRGQPVCIWDVTLPNTTQRPQRCIRAGDRANKDSWDLLDAIRWHPDGLSIFVLYQDTTIVHFDFIEGGQIENEETLAREMIVSPDGNILLTCNYAGTVSLWSLPHFRQLYQLHYDYEESVQDVVFSPDSQRFMDLRGSICNVWQPDILIRADETEADELSSADNTGDPLTQLGSQITSLASGPTEAYYICGKDNGTVVMYDAVEGKRVKNVYSHAKDVAVVTLACSPSGKYVASFDENGRVFTKRLQQKQGHVWAVFPGVDFRLESAEGSAQQFLFSPSEELLLVSSINSDRVWNLKTKLEVFRRNRESVLGVRLINHPSNKDMILSFEQHKTSIMHWSALKEPTPLLRLSHTVAPYVIEGFQTSSHRAESNPMLSPSIMALYDGTSSNKIRRVTLSPDRSIIICETPLGIVGGNQVLLEAIEMNKMREQRIKDFQRVPIPSLEINIERFLGFYEDHLVFLDKQYWVCTWHMNQLPEFAKRHFFIPRHWISPSSLPLITFLHNGTLFFPKHGEVAIIRSRFKL
ncbi:hypothetical protein MMC19_003851 [Ptychographa xylographoides]|nr:hypothetical protein [Ptychographa xylographoides]